MTDRDLMRQALEALENCTYDEEGYCLNPDNEDVIAALRERLARQEQEPVACDGDFPEGFDASLGIPAQALRTANAIMFDVIGKREWDVPCTARHLLSFALKHTAPPPAQQPLTMQPIIKDQHGVLRFKKNGLVVALYEHGVKTGLGLNELHLMDFTDEDRQQFAQLIGYSVSGYGSLSYVTDQAYEAAEQAAHGITGEKK